MNNGYPPTMNNSYPYAMDAETKGNVNESTVDPTAGPLPRSSNVKSQSDTMTGAAPHQVIHNHYHGFGSQTTGPRGERAESPGQEQQTVEEQKQEDEGANLNPTQTIDASRKNLRKWIGSFSPDDTRGASVDPGVTLRDAYESRMSPGKGLSIDTKHLQGESGRKKENLDGTVKTPVGVRYNPQKLKEIRETRKDKRNRGFMV